MADTKISDLTALAGASAAVGDLLEIVDVSDTTMAASGTNKKITFADLRTPAADSVDNTMLANMVQATIKGRASAAGTGDPTDLTASQVRTILAYTATLISISDLTGYYTGTNVEVALTEIGTRFEEIETNLTTLNSGTQTVATTAGSTYTVGAGDATTLIRLTGTCTVTLPSAGPTVGQRVDFVSIGGPATFTLGGGASWDVTPTPSAVARAVGSFVTAVKMGSATWALTGDLA